MNKEKLLELSETLRGIAEGKDFEVHSTVHGTECVESCHPERILNWLGAGWNIRLKSQPPPPDSYAEFKAAHAAGKVIEYNPDAPNGEWHVVHIPRFNEPLHHYRIKPEPQKLPLCADDVKAGDEFLSPSGFRRQWSFIGENEVGFNDMNRAYQALMDNKWKIRSIGETEWRPCYKLVEQ
jgi:hypothetical protein